MKSTTFRMLHVRNLKVHPAIHRVTKLARGASKGERKGKGPSITQMKVHEAAGLRSRSRLRLPTIGCVGGQEARGVPNGSIADDALAGSDHLRPALLGSLPVLRPQLDACCLAPCMPEPLLIPSSSASFQIGDILLMSF